MKTTACILTLGLFALSGCDSKSGAPGESNPQIAVAGVVPSMATSNGSEQDSSPLVVRRLWLTPALEFWGDPSPDGRYLTYVDRTKGDLALHDFHTGEDRRVTGEGANSSETPQQAVLSTFSPDGERIAYGWIRDGCDELRVASVNGSEPRVLYRNESADVNPEEWSEDGSQILVNIAQHNGTRQLGLVSVSNGTLRVLKTFPEPTTFVSEATISPDGRYVIYDWPASSDGEARDVFVLNVDGGGEHAIVDHPADDRVLGWAPDGKHILFASDRTGTMGAWLLPVDDARASGEPVLVKPELWRARPLGFDAKGSYYYGVNSRTSDVFVAGIDLETGRLLESPAPVTNRFTGSNHDALWSPDGRYLAYLSDRGSVTGRVGNVAIVIQSAESGEKREILPPLFQPSRLDWSPDGQFFLIQAARTYGEEEGLYRIDVMTGEVEPLVLWTTDEPVFGVWAGNTQTLLLYRLFWSDAGIEDERSRISVLDLETGEESVLAERNVYWPTISHDRQYVAFTQRQENSSGDLTILSIAGGEPRTILQFKTGGPEWPLNLVWGPDGRHVYYMLRGQRGESENDPVRGIWRVPVAGGEPEKMGWATEVYLGEASLRFHPDGRRIALVRRQQGAEVWVLENFLPSGDTGN